MNFLDILDDANRLRSNSPLITIIEDNVQTLLYRINSQILDAFEQHKDHILCKLPINFDMQNTQLSNKTVQINVYYKIIEALEKKNYIIKIKIEEKLTLLYISWKKNIDNRTITNMQKKIDSLTF